MPDGLLCLGSDDRTMLSGTVIYVKEGYGVTVAVHFIDLSRGGEHSAAWLVSRGGNCVVTMDRRQVFKFCDEGLSRLR
jgi:hypothetical protein